MALPPAETANVRPIPPLPRLIFASRWLQLPLYAGLIVAQVVYVRHFWVELTHLVEAAFGNQDALAQIVAAVTPPGQAASTAKTPSERVILLVVLGLIAEASRALVLNGLLRFPLVVSYCFFGLLLAGLLATDPAFATLMEGRRPDSLVPVFLSTWLPPGLRGLLLPALLAAVMSSIDSALNSLAAVTLEDVLDRPPDAQGVWIGRATALGWGVFAIVSGLLFARGEAGVREGINQIGSASYGLMLAVFLLGALAPGVGARGVMVGLVAGGSPGHERAQWLANQERRRLDLDHS